jgi:hypothetical protein
MFVDPARRGTGVSVAVLHALEEAAVARGWTTLRLETGTEQPDGVRVYTGRATRRSRSSGTTRTPRSRCALKRRFVLPSSELIRQDQQKDPTHAAE